jgi:hypothetical protein
MTSVFGENPRWGWILQSENGAEEGVRVAGHERLRLHQGEGI